MPRWRAPARCIVVWRWVLAGAARWVRAKGGVCATQVSVANSIKQEVKVSVCNSAHEVGGEPYMGPGQPRLQQLPRVRVTC